MPNKFFQDMVKVKREKAGLLEHKHVSKPTPEPPKPAPAPKPAKVELPKISEQKPSEEQPDETKFASVYDRADTTVGKRKSSRTLWLVAGICVVFLFFALSFVFSGATVTIDPRVKDVALNKTFFATKDSIDGNLPFDLVSISGEETVTLQGGEEKETKESAEGAVVIYNAFNSSSQRLDINTRLEGSNGKVYKTKNQVTVPGVSPDGKPGSVEVGIYASLPGAEYNSGPLDFTVLGFKGTSRYSKFYARSKGNITGGFSGKLRVISDSDKETALGNLQVALKDKLLKKATDTIPGGFILFKDAVFLDVDGEDVGVATEDGMVPFTLKGTLYGFLFEEKKLTEKIATGAVEKYDGSEVYISNIRNLSFTLSDQDALLFKDIKNITFNLTGNLKIIWKLDEGKIVADMLGKQKKDFTEILSMYPNVVSADVTFKPFWKKSFSQKADDLKLIVNYPE